MAKLYYYYGAMGSSKTANALMTHFNYEEVGQKALLCKPAIDARDGERTVYSRIGLQHDCILLEELQQMKEEEIRGYDCIIVDEVQFATPQQVDFLSDIVDFMDVPVVCYGLRADFRNLLFPGSERLIAIADVDMIKSMGKEIFRENYKQWCKEKGYRFQSEKADELFHLAEDGIPTLPTEFPSTRLCMEVATEQVSQLGYALEQILSQMQNLAKTLPEYQTIRQMGGMGEKLCVRFIADIGDVRRFHNGKALVAYAGIDAPPYQSGQYTGTKRRISKRGNSALRKTGYEVMKSLKSHPPKTDTRVYDFIIKKENEGKSKKQAKIAGLNKFLQIYYARVIEIYKNIV